MKNRMIAWMLVISILISMAFVFPVYAAKSDSYMVPSYGIYQSFMENSFPDAFNKRLYLATLDDCSDLDNLIDKASWIIGEDLSVERCTEILANMVTLMNYQLEDAIVEQSSVDTTKTLLDYGMDLAGIAAGGVGVSSLKAGSDAVIKRISTVIGITNGALDFTANTIEDLELLVQLEGDYSMQYDFLETVYMYADIPEMKEAAQSLILANKEIMRYKLETITSVGESFAKFEATDVFLDQVAGELLKDPDFWDSDAYGPLMVLSEVYSKFSLFKLTLDIGLFLGDSLFGTSDIYNRYNEMLAMRDIHNALLARVKANPVLNEEDYENMDRNISLMKMALYVDARGEYCVYQMTTEGKLSELFSSANEESIEKNYNISIDIIENTFASLDGLYVEEEWDNTSGESYESFAAVIEGVQTRINYNNYSESQKEYCRGDFFDVDGKKALVLMYYVLGGSDLTPGYYVGLWVENSDGTISCLTDQLIEETDDPDDAYVTVNIREIDGKMYLNPSVRTTNDNADISKNQYFYIGDNLMLECDLYSETPFVSMGDGLIQHDDSKSVYYLNHEQVDRSTFYSMQDKLNIGSYILGINPNWSEGRPPEGYTFEELLSVLDTFEISAGELSVFEQLPSEFIFTSGVGAWGTYLYINADGTFTGEYHDTNMSDTGSGYPNGTVYICNFSGKFTPPKKLSEYIYAMKIETLNVEGTSGTEYFENDLRYIISEPCGMENANEFLLYLPGTPIAELSEEFLSWAHLGNPPIRETTPSGYFGLYNVGGQEGFAGMVENNIWYGNYMYYYQGRKAALWPEYDRASLLVFWPESGAATIDLLFTWSADDQTEFDAYDTHGSGDYHISLDISDDLKAVKVTVTSDSGVDLSAWGGTPDGHLTAVFVDE